MSLSLPAIAQEKTISLPNAEEINSNILGYKTYTATLSDEQRNALTELENLLIEEKDIDGTIITNGIRLQSCIEQKMITPGANEDYNTAFIRWRDEQNRFQDLKRSGIRTMASRLEFLNIEIFSKYDRALGIKTMLETAQNAKTALANNTLASEESCAKTQQILTPYLAPSTSDQATELNKNGATDDLPDYEELTTKVFFKLCLQNFLAPYNLKTEIESMGFAAIPEDKEALFAYPLKMQKPANFWMTQWADGFFLLGVSEDGSSCHFGRNFKLDFGKLFENVGKTVAYYKAQDLIDVKLASKYNPPFSFDGFYMLDLLPKTGKDFDIHAYFAVNPAYNIPKGQFGTLMIMSKN